MSDEFLKQSAEHDANDLSSVVQAGGHWCICAWAWASAVQRDPSRFEGITLECERTNLKLREVYESHIAVGADLRSPSGAAYKAKAALDAVNQICPLPATAQAAAPVAGSSPPPVAALPSSQQSSGRAAARSAPEAEAASLAPLASPSTSPSPSPRASKPSPMMLAAAGCVAAGLAFAIRSRCRSLRKGSEASPLKPRPSAPNLDDKLGCYDSCEDGMSDENQGDLPEVSMTPVAKAVV